MEVLLERSDKDAVLDYLSQQKITPVNISLSSSLLTISWREIRKASYLKTFSLKILSSSKVSDEQLIMFCRQMYTINKAGTPLAQGMQSLALSMAEGDLRETVEDIVSRLKLGMSLSVAMRHHNSIFYGLFISIVQVGEGSGNLNEVFTQLAHYIECDVSTRKSIKAAIHHPSFVLVAMAIAMVVINIYVIPAFF
ncbi:MAG: MSHA biogenesis protein MshG [Cellvibrionaceae bacterium]